MSSLTLPVCTTAEPTTFRIALASIAGVASAGRSVTASIAALPVIARNCRRVVSFGLSIVGQAFLFAQRCQIRHDILDLLGRQHRLAAPRRSDAIEPID